MHLEKASTQKSAKTHARDVLWLVTLTFDFLAPKNKTQIIKHSVGMAVD